MGLLRTILIYYSLNSLEREHRKRENVVLYQFFKINLYLLRLVIVEEIIYAHIRKIDINSGS